MKLVMDERLKHRLVGLAVILSVGVIFVPAVMKKSNQRFEGKTTVSLKLPPKPVLPNVAMPSDKTLFKTMKVAHVDIASVGQRTQPVIHVAKAESLTQMSKTKVISSIAKKEVKISVVPSLQDKKIVLTHAKLAAKASLLQMAQNTAKAKPSMVSTTKYAVQVATFTLHSNAVSLVSKLKTKGYIAAVKESGDKKKIVYRVLVGRADQKQEAQRLQQQLASAMQIKGFVVSTKGIS